MKVIVHLDLDCFYAQVEAVRLGVDCRTVPFVVSQWGNLIAVNYPARAAGIKRFESLSVARKKCPELQYAHTATYAVGETEFKYHENPVKRSHKVALEPYRDASAKIFAILSSYESLGVVLEKGGVDEAFLDVTAAVIKPAGDLLQECRSEVMLERVRDRDCNAELKPVDFLASINDDDTAALRDKLLRRTGTLSKVILQDQATVAHYAAFLSPEGVACCIVEDYSPDEGLLELAQLAAASIFVSEIRSRVREELHYDCSGGIAHNKMLSKLISATNKPNKQTVLLPSATLSFIATAKFEKLRGFGGKLGRKVTGDAQNSESCLCGELWCRSRSWLAAQVGGEDDDGSYIYKRIRGYCDSAVEPRAVSKSLMAQKVFSPPSRDVAVLRKWLTVLAGELHERWRVFAATNEVTARHLNIRFGPAATGRKEADNESNGMDYGNMRLAKGQFNRTFPLPVPTTADSILEIGSRFVAQLLQKNTSTKLMSVTVSITDFKRCREDGPGGKRQQQTLDSMFRSESRRGEASAKPIDVESSSSCDDADDSIVICSDDCSHSNEEEMQHPKVMRDQRASRCPVNPVTFSSRVDVVDCDAPGSDEADDAD
jgi:DNA polymerase eta